MGAHVVAIRLAEEAYLEHVRRELRLEPEFSAEAFERAFERFVQIYNVPPTQACCSPDVLERYCHLFERAEATRMRQFRYRGIPVFAAVLAPGTIAFEGEVDEDRMGDW